jgi:hypothetical protein
MGTVAGRWLLTCLVTLVCIAAIVYGAGHLLVRTEGFKGLLAEKIEEHLAMPVQIEAVGLDAEWNLVVTGLLTERFGQAGVPGFGVEQAVIDWSLPGLLFTDRPMINRLRFKRANLALAQNDKGQWEPALCAPLAMWLARWARFNMGRDEEPHTPVAVAEKNSRNRLDKDSDKLPEGLRSMQLELQDCGVRWWNRNGRELAAAMGIDVISTPVTLPQRHVQHYRVEMDEAYTIGNRHVRDVLFELLSTQGHHIMLCFKAEWTTENGSLSERVTSADHAQAGARSMQKSRQVNIESLPDRDAVLVDEIRTELNEAVAGDANQ